MFQGRVGLVDRESAADCVAVSINPVAGAEPTCCPDAECAACGTDSFLPNLTFSGPTCA